MTIGMIEASNRRAAILSARANKKLKELRKETRAVMQRFEGVSDLSEDEKTTYNHLTLSMVILNALSDHLLKFNHLPRTWDEFTLGSDFDRNVTPLLCKNAEGELWVEYFECDRPKAALLLVAGDLAKPIPDGAPIIPRRPPVTKRTVRPQQPAPAPVEEVSMMDLIRMRMPTVATTRYKQKLG